MRFKINYAPYDHQYVSDGEVMYSPEVVRRLLFRLGDKRETIDNQKIARMAKSLGLTPKKIRTGINRSFFYTPADVKEICKQSIMDGYSRADENFDTEKALEKIYAEIC